MCDMSIVPLLLIRTYIILEIPTHFYISNGMFVVILVIKSPYDYKLDSEKTCSSFHEKGERWYVHLTGREDLRRFLHLGVTNIVRLTP
jgi:hypothetical protein